MKSPEVFEHNFIRDLEHINNDTKKQLKPCPFCGNTEIEFALIHPQYNGKPDMDYWCYWEILCPNCGVSMENGRGQDQTWEEAMDEIIDLWNTRVMPD